MDYLGQLLANGLVLGAIYALAAVAFTLVYGVVRLVNFAFGELFMLGAFLTASLMLPEVRLLGTIVPMPGFSLPVAAAGAIALTAALGVLVDRIAYRPLRNAPRLAPLITSIAVSVVLQSLAQTVWGAEELRFPEFHLATLPPVVLFDSIYLSVMDLVVMATALAAMLGLSAFIARSSLGRAMRASAEDQMAATLVAGAGDEVRRWSAFRSTGWWPPPSPSARALPHWPGCSMRRPMVSPIPAWASCRG